MRGLQLPTGWWLPNPHHFQPSSGLAARRLHYAATVALNVGEAALLCQVVPALCMAPLRSAPAAGPRQACCGPPGRLQRLHVADPLLHRISAAIQVSSNVQ